MTSRSSITSPTVRVAIDVAKLTHQVLLELPNGKRRVIRVANTRRSSITSWRRPRLDHPCEVAFEPTGDYHRPLAYMLSQAGCRLRFVSTLAVARTREALYNTWDKNDPKDAQVILHLLKHGTTQAYVDPLVSGHQDLQEIANTYHQISLRKTRLHHSLLTHYLPLYFPEAERYLHSSRAEWFTELLLFTPCPAAVRTYTKTAFVAAATAHVAGARSIKPGGSPTSMTPRAEASDCRCRRIQRRCGCFGWCSRTIGRSASGASSWRPTSSPGWPTSGILCGCRRSRASDRFWP